jgi:hypothetical protein|tara:strand:+ start:6616 stop:7092 length:477 start_codon:yes stop_codon:yes gene_type:complete
MPRIKNIEKDTAVTGNDKVLGTDVSGATKNYLVSDLAAVANAAILGFQTITHSTNTHTIDLNSDANNYNISAQNAVNTLILSNFDVNVGKSGTIVITNPSLTGSLSWAPLQASVYTPGGSSISFNLTANKIAILTYFVATSSKILVNYVGNFGSYPQP